MLIIGMIGGLITGGVLMTTDGYKRQIAGAITCIASIIIPVFLMAVAL